jgi:hypothetical protein
VWADLRARRAQQAQVSAGTPDHVVRQPLPPLGPGTRGKLLEHEVAATLGMAEDLAGWARAKAVDALRDAEAKVNEIQRGMNGLAQELHEIVESVSGALAASVVPLTAAKDPALDEAGRTDVVEIPPAEDLPQYAAERPS